MRRDMDLVRHILLEVEAAEGDVPLDKLVCGRWRMPQVIYHVKMMVAHGLLDATLFEGYHGTSGGVVNGLTWDGADYLDAIRDDGIWRRTKDLVKATAGSVTMAVIKEAASLVALKSIREGLGTA